MSEINSSSSFSSDKSIFLILPVSVTCPEPRENEERYRFSKLLTPNLTLFLGSYSLSITTTLDNIPPPTPPKIKTSFLVSPIHNHIHVLTLNCSLLILSLAFLAHWRLLYRKEHYYSYLCSQWLAEYLNMVDSHQLQMNVEFTDNCMDG